jgi:hypothetical protein
LAVWISLREWLVEVFWSLRWNLPVLNRLASGMIVFKVGSGRCSDSAGKDLVSEFSIVSGSNGAVSSTKSVALSRI